MATTQMRLAAADDFRAQGRSPQLQAVILSTPKGTTGLAELHRRTDRTGTESAPRRARVVISMKTIKPLSEEKHQLLRAAARDPQLAPRRAFPKV